MKHYLIIFVFAIFASTALAQVQFVPYRPLREGQNSNGYSNQQSQQQENSQMVNAYFINQRGAFERIPIKVVYVSQWGQTWINVREYYDRQMGRWHSTNSSVSEVDVLDSQVIKENFTYKAYLQGYGYLYF